MAVGSLFYTPVSFQFDVNGVPLAGGQLWFYANGTTTPQTVYADLALTTPLANPVVADANGRWPEIFLDQTVGYSVALYTAATPDNPTGVQLWTVPNVGPGAGGGQSNIAGIVGEIRFFAGLSASIPSGWYACYGQAVSRTTYSALFAVLGTTWGAGDGSTTFNLPDMRGRAAIGQDNMGGVPAGRVTAGVSGVPGSTIGGTGGSQNAQQDTLTASSVSTSTVTDPAHSHPEIVGQSTGGSNASWVIVNTSGTTNTIQNTATVTTGITVATTTTTTVTSGLTGTAQNMPPVAVVLSIIYAGV